MRVAAIIVAGGRGERLGAAVPKQLIELGGRPILQRSVEVFLQHPRVGRVVVVLPAAAAQVLARAMREVVLDGTGRALKAVEPPVAGKTGTAEVKDQASHSWFIGFAPYGRTPGRRIAFAVIVENGGYGASVAAPIAGDIVAAARDLGIIK
jgi:cell division protein FtsI/penicillin-binding protein 2